MRERANVVVTPERFGSLDAALRKLKRKLAETGVLAAMNRHAYYTKPSERKRLKSTKARKRARRTETERYHAFNKNASRDAIYKQSA